MFVFFLLTLGSMIGVIIFSYFLSKKRIDKKNESSVSNKKNEEWALARATTQNNQLRIALISISLGIFVNATTYDLTESKKLILMYSAFAVVCGLYAWNSSANFFYNTGKRNLNEKDKDNLKMKTGDTSLVLSLLISGLLTLLVSLGL